MTVQNLTLLLTYMIQVIVNVLWTYTYGKKIGTCEFLGRYKVL